jgi:hypothetical protein
METTDAHLHVPMWWDLNCLKLQSTKSFVHPLLFNCLPSLAEIAVLRSEDQIATRNFERLMEASTKCIHADTPKRHKPQIQRGYRERGT